MKISDTIVSYILKKGILWEGRNIDAEVEVPTDMEPIKIKIKCEHLTLSIEKEEK